MVQIRQWAIPFCVSFCFSPLTFHQLQDGFSSVKAVMEHMISKVGTFVFWPAACDDLINQSDKVEL